LGSGSRDGFNRSVGSSIRSWSFIVWIGGGRGPIGGRRNRRRRLAFAIWIMPCGGTGPRR
jgi:hypothetical protein